MHTQKPREAQQVALPKDPPSQARLSVELADLYPPGVIAAELLGEASPEALTPLEFNSISHCAEKRISDFTRGRACARRALREWGVEDFSLLSGDQREPLWPTEFTGSITHTAGFAAAAVAQCTNVESLGIDCEHVESVNEELWERVCTPGERERLALLPPTQRQPQATLIFAAKEAFYKCQFPLTRAWVGFEAVSIEPLDWPATSGVMRIVPQSALPVSDAWVAALVARFQFRDSWVITGVTALV